MNNNAQQTVMAKAKYTVHAADLARDRETVLGLWKQAFPTPRKHPVKYDWCYGPTPQGPGRLYLLASAGEAHAIGVQGIVPRQWWLQGATRICGICADLVVDQHHRSVGPALSLVRQVAEREQHDGRLGMLYGFPNLKSEALYRRAGYNSMGVITRYMQPLRLHVWLERRGVPTMVASVLGMLADRALQMRSVLAGWRSARCWECVAVEGFDSRFDELWSRVASTSSPMVMRNAEYLRWRFRNHFARQARVMVLQRHGGGQIDAYVVYLVGNNKMITVVDFLAADNEVVLTAMFCRFAQAMYRRGYVGIMLEFSGPAAVVASLRRCGFVARETSPIYAVFGQHEIGWQKDATPYFTSSDRDQ